MILAASSFVNNPMLASILAWAIEPSTSNGANSRSNSLSLPTVNFSTCFDVSVLSLLHSFIILALRVEYTVQCLYVFHQYKYTHQRYDCERYPQGPSSGFEKASM